MSGCDDRSRLSPFSSHVRHPHNAASALQQHEKTLILLEPMKHYGVASVFDQPVANSVRTTLLARSPIVLCDVGAVTWGLARQSITKRRERSSFSSTRSRWRSP